MGTTHKYKYKEIIILTLLPLNVCPLIDCYNFESFPYSIVSANKTYDDWVMCHYLSISMQKDFKNADVPFRFYLLDYTLIPGLEVQKIDMELLKNTFEIDIIQFIKKVVTQGYYVYCNVDEKYLSTRYAYNRFNFSHDILVYGVENEMIYTRGYDRTRHLKTEKISSEVFKKAFLSPIHSDKNETRIFLYRPEESKFIASKSEMLKQLENLYYSKNLSECTSTYVIPEDLVYGMECFQFIKKYYLLAKTDSELRDFHLMKVPHKLLEHIKCLEYSITQMVKKGFVFNDYTDNLEKLINLSILMKALTMKFSLTSNINLLDKCINLINQIFEKEKELLMNLIVELKT